MKQQLIIIGFVVLVTWLCGCTEISHDFEYVNNEYGFGFDPPEEWMVLENVSEEVAVGVSPLQRERVWLNVSTPSRSDEGLALSMFADRVEEQFVEEWYNFSVISRDWRDHEDLNAYEIVYVYDSNGSSVQVQQVAVSKSHTVFLIMFTASPFVFEEFSELVDQSIDSFRII